MKEFHSMNGNYFIVKSFMRGYDEEKEI